MASRRPSRPVPPTRQSEAESGRSLGEKAQRRSGDRRGARSDPVGQPRAPRGQALVAHDSAPGTKSGQGRRGDAVPRAPGALREESVIRWELGPGDSAREDSQAKSAPVGRCLDWACGWGSSARPRRPPIQPGRPVGIGGGTAPLPLPRESAGPDPAFISARPAAGGLQERRQRPGVPAGGGSAS